MAITRAQQVRQMLEDGGMLVSPSMTGKRPGYRGEAAAASDAAGGRDAGRSDTGSASGRGDGPSGGGNGGGNGGGDDRRERFMGLQGKTGKVEGVQRNTGLEQNRLSNIMKMDRFTKFRPEVKTPPLGVLSFLKGPLQGFSNFTTERNRKFFDKVIGAGKYQLTGDLAKYGKLDYGDLSEMTDEELEQAYQSLMSDRLSGKTDAYGNLLNQGDDGPDNTILFPQDTTPGDGNDSNDDDTNTGGLNIRFRKDGGRIGFRGGDAARSDAASGRNAGRADPSGGVERPGGGGGGENNNQQTVTAPVNIPKPVKDAINLGGDVSYLKNLIELNPVGIMKNIGGKLIMDKIFGDQTSLDTEDENMKMAELSQKQLDFLNSPKIQRDLKEFGREPKAVFDMLPDYEERPFFGPNQEPTTPEEFNEYLDSINVPRMQAAEGGIMDLETGRQMYFLGKLVKKATRAVKKITKSPLGKAALIAGLGIYGGGGFGVLKNKGLSALASNFFSKSNPLLFDAAGKLSMGKLAAVSAASPFLFGQEEEDEEEEFYRGPSLDIARIRNNPYDFRARRFAVEGGIMRTGYQEGSKEPVAKKTMPLLDMGGKEMDLREDGGFVPIGRMEKADDVPARLSKNEFVFTADAVRNAGDGNVDKGAEVMYNMMKNLESGGDVSEESQGLSGAREMFQTSKRLEEVL